METLSAPPGRAPSKSVSDGVAWGIIWGSFGDRSAIGWGSFGYRLGCVYRFPICLFSYFLFFPVSRFLSLSFNRFLVFSFSFLLLSLSLFRPGFRRATLGSCRTAWNVPPRVTGRCVSAESARAWSRLSTHTFAPRPSFRSRDHERYHPFTICEIMILCDEVEVMAAATMRFYNDSYTLRPPTASL